MTTDLSARRDGGHIGGHEVPLGDALVRVEATKYLRVRRLRRRSIKLGSKTQFSNNINKSVAAEHASTPLCFYSVLSIELFARVT